MCKKCKKAFRKDIAEYDESDEYCPHCDNHYVSTPICILGLMLNGTQVLEAKTPIAALGVEGEDARVDSRSVSLPTLH